MYALIAFSAVLLYIILIPWHERKTDAGLIAPGVLVAISALFAYLLLARSAPVLILASVPAFVFVGNFISNWRRNHRRG